MRFDLCAPLSVLPIATDAGFDYPEPPLAPSALRPAAFNVFLPGDLKVVGPDTDTRRQERYLDTALS